MSYYTVKYTWRGSTYSVDPFAALNLEDAKNKFAALMNELEQDGWEIIEIEEVKR